MDSEHIEKDSAVEQWPGLHTKLFNPKKSPIQQYKEMVTGDSSWGVLFYYELTILLFSLIPGALGIALRKFFFKPLFKKVGRNVVFGRNMVLRQPQKITIGDNVIIDDDCTLDAKGESNDGITIGDMVTIGRFSSLYARMRISTSARMLISAQMSKLSQQIKAK